MSISYEKLIDSFKFNEIILISSQESRVKTESRPTPNPLRGCVKTIIENDNTFKLKHEFEISQ